MSRFQNSDFHPTHNFAYNADHCRVTTILITRGGNKIGNGYKNEGEGKVSGLKCGVNVVICGSRKVSSIDVRDGNRNRIR